MTWYANCVFTLPLREGVERPAVEAAVRSLADYFKTSVYASDLPHKLTWLQLAEQKLSVRFRGTVSDDFGQRILEPAVRALEPLAASPVAIAVFDGGAPLLRSSLTPYTPRLTMTVGATSLLPQLEPVHGLIDAALQAAGQLPDTPLRARLIEAVAAFASLRTTQGWTVQDVTEQAGSLSPALQLTRDQAHSLLFKMDELTETLDIENAVFNRCVADGLIVDDPDMPDSDEWDEICEEFGLDPSFLYTEDQVREHTRAYRAEGNPLPPALNSLTTR